MSIGLAFATLADRLRRGEALAKSMIFLPMAICFVGAAVTWRLIYSFRPGGLRHEHRPAERHQARPRAGPGARGCQERPWNNLLLMVIMVWMQTGFAMVVLSAAIKAIPDEILEAARIDGATEFQVFRRIMIPNILPTIVVVTTYMVINALKVFDIVFVIGNAETNGTEVIAERMIQWFFISNHDGRGAAIAVVLFLAIIPVMVWNVRQFRAAGGDRDDRWPRRSPASAAERAGPSPARDAPYGTIVGGARAGWFVRITILVVVLLWLVPTARRARHVVPRRATLVNTTGWWTVLAHPFEAGQWTLENYRHALDAEGFQNAFLNSVAVAVPATVMPIAIAAFAAYAFSWMEFRGRQLMFVLVVGLMVVPLQMALIPILRLYTGGASLGGMQIIPDLDLNGTFLGVWLAHTGFGLPLATYLLRNYIGSLPSSIIESATHRRRRPLHDLLAARRPAVGAGAGGVRHLPVPVGVERPARRLRVPRGHVAEPRADDRAPRAQRRPTVRTGTC